MAVKRNLGLPSGVVFPFAGNTAPTGYLICDGRAVSRSDYADLFGVIGVTYGTGDGSSTFNLPDYRAQFMRGRIDVTSISGSGSVVAGTNNATFMGHGVNRTGFKIRLSSGTLTGLSTGTDYYTIVIDDNTLAFSDTLTNALAGTKLSISGTNTAVLVQYEDPDYTSRTSSNSVGSRQEDDFKSHTHYYGRSQDWGSGSANSFDARSGASYITTATGGSETRPRNVLTNYIIKT